MFGEGPEKDSLLDLTLELGLAERVLFFGYCDCVENLLEEFEGLIICSLTEGIPLVALEAMRASLPIIASRVGGLPESP